MPAGTVRKIIIHSIRTDREFLIIAFHGISNCEEASMLRNAMIEVDASMLPELGNNQYYYHQIIGLSVVTVDGEMIGTVTDIMETPSNEVYVVQGHRTRNILSLQLSLSLLTLISIPALMTITPIDGLLD